MTTYEVFAIEPDASIYTFGNLTGSNKAAAIRHARQMVKTLISPAAGVGVYDRTNEQQVFFIDLSAKVRR